MMVELRDGKASDSEVLCALIFASAPILLPYLFGSKTHALEYIAKAANQPDGQYSAVRHRVAYKGAELIACITLWDNQLPKSFHSHTLQSLATFLTPRQITHLITTNEKIKEVFEPPLPHQLCIGHLSVLEQYKGMGIGQMMIAYATMQAKLRKKPQLVLDVDSHNEEAVGFYTGLGFMLMSSNYFPPTQQTFYRMQYNL